MARAMAFCEIPMGRRYSSKSISPGVIALFITIAARLTVAGAVKSGKEAEAQNADLVRV
jgi:hypothetical protein